MIAAVDLSDISDGPCRAQALKALEDGDANVFLLSADNMLAPQILCKNVAALKARGMYEAALLYALTMPRLNLAHVPPWLVTFLISVADRAALLACGDPLPRPAPFTVYRGVAGRGRARRVRGVSWTFSLPTAAWFANRAGDVFRLSDPAVYEVVVAEPEVLAYSNGRREQELLIKLDADRRPRRCLEGAELRRLAEKHGAAMHAENVARLEALKQRGNSLSP